MYSLYFCKSENWIYCLPLMTCLLLGCSSLNYTVKDKQISNVYNIPETFELHWDVDSSIVESEFALSDNVTPSKQIDHTKYGESFTETVRHYLETEFRHPMPINFLNKGGIKLRTYFDDFYEVKPKKIAKNPAGRGIPQGSWDELPPSQQDRIWRDGLEYEWLQTDAHGTIKTGLSEVLVIIDDYEKNEIAHFLISSQKKFLSPKDVAREIDRILNEIKCSN